MCDVNFSVLDCGCLVGWEKGGRPTIRKRGGGEQIATGVATRWWGKEGQVLGSYGGTKTAGRLKREKLDGLFIKGHTNKEVSSRQVEDRKGKRG